MDHVPTHQHSLRRRRETRIRCRLSLALLLCLALVAAACGDDDDDSAGESDQSTTVPTEGTEATTDDTTAPTDTTEAAPETTAAPASDVDPDGVLRIGGGLVFPAGIHLDPTQSAVNADRPWMELVFGTLLRWSDDGSIVPWMAESFELVDPQTLTLTIRDGITFADGNPYDAEAVAAGLLRTLNEASETTLPSLSVAFLAITDVAVVDPLTVTISLSSPQAGELAQALADREGVIVSPAQAASDPDAIDSSPVGAGPYVVEEFIDGQSVVLVKNPDYWDADSWQLAGVEWVNVTDGASVVNGLLSDVIDVFTGLSPTDAARLDDRFTVESRPTDRSYIALLVCSGKPPFDDENVRHALQVAIDRQTISDLVYDGLADPAVGLWPEDHVYYNPALEDIVTYDPDQARELLGGETVPMDLAFIGVVPDHDTVVEVLQAQLNEVGFDVNIVTTQDPVSEFITPQSPGALLVPGSRTGVDKYNRMFAEGQSQVLCGVPRPDVIDPLTAASALIPGDPSAADLFQQADLTIAEGAYLVPVVWTPQLVVWNSERLGGEQLFNSSASQPLIDTFYVRN